MLVCMVLGAPSLCMSVICRHRRKSLSYHQQRPSIHVNPASDFVESRPKGKSWFDTGFLSAIQHTYSFFVFEEWKYLFSDWLPMCFYSLFSKPRILFRSRSSTALFSGFTNWRIVQFSDANLLSFFRRILRNLYNYSFVKVGKMCVCPTCVTCDKRFLHYRHPTRKICYMVMDFGSHKADQTTPEIDFRSFASTKISCTFAALIKVVHKFHG